jgi:transcriptional regulator with XRE-family HTH domain
MVGAHEEVRAGGGTRGVTFREVQAEELGAFLRTRRERADPALGGWSGSARRRAPGLRREEVAAVAGLTVSWLARLEQGKAQSVSAQVLGALARALRLDELEREHLFALAGLRADPPSAPPTEVPASIIAVLHALEPNPAYVLDRAWNMVAWNSAEARLFPGILERVPPNLLEFVFCDDRIRSLIVGYEDEAAQLVSQFRTHCTDWPGDPGITEVVDRLCATSDDFAQRWASHDVAPFATTRRVFDHPIAGRLEFEHHRLEVLDQPGTILVAFVDAPGSDSSARLAITAG